MRLKVRVPVLSVHKTVAAPKVSIAATRLVKTLRLEMRQAPSARKTVKTTGNSSGKIAIASVSPDRKPLIKSWRTITKNSNTTTHKDKATVVTLRTIIAVSL